MIAKEQLQAMSDFEVNKALAELMGLKISKNQYMDYGDRDERVVIIDRQSVGDTTVDYCNTPNDIMPLQIERRLSLDCVNHQTDGYWIAGANTFYHVADTNPLRAIACCLILVLQEKKK